ncbi:MAG: hypothetical protein HKO59_09025 [Phycisphaerales bacterium]|nr:hypothetical protein [Phycisphaerae bacterium]NNF45084.1 hypothetical protein [Phycisphaerales bacterium]NNM26111.1 hypothetical protein [Phycisphaerales bacterium]
MRSSTTLIGAHLHVRRCVACGYDGSYLGDLAADHCSQCGCDFRARPPRSYAEMEGLAGPGGHAFATLDRCDTRGNLQRWLVFIFFLLIGLFAVLSLFAAAVP